MYFSKVYSFLSPSELPNSGYIKDKLSFQISTYWYIGWNIWTPLQVIFSTKCAPSKYYSRNSERVCDVTEVLCWVNDIRDCTKFWSTWQQKRPSTEMCLSLSFLVSCLGTPNTSLFDITNPPIFIEKKSRLNIRYLKQYHAVSWSVRLYYFTVEEEKHCYYYSSQ